MHAELPFSSARLNNAGNELETLPHAAVASHRVIKKNQRSEPQYPPPKTRQAAPTLYIRYTSRSAPNVRQRTLCVQRSQKLTLREQVLRDGEYTALLRGRASVSFSGRYFSMYFSRASPRTPEPDPPLDMPLELDLPTEARGVASRCGLGGFYIILT
jgi:hypothetical protein